MTPEQTCSDCGGQLEIGFIPDLTMGAALQATWHRGEPDDKTILDFLKYGPGVKYDRTRLISIRAWRCTRCGLLNLFALDPTPISSSKDV